MRKLVLAALAAPALLAVACLPAWAQELSYKYCSKTANLYIVNGNIRDFLPNKMYEGEFIFVRIQEFISEVLFGNRDIIIFFDRSSKRLRRSSIAIFSFSLRPSKRGFGKSSEINNERT